MVKESIHSYTSILVCNAFKLNIKSMYEAWKTPLTTYMQKQVTVKGGDDSVNTRLATTQVIDI